MRGLDARFPVEVRVRSGREYREAFADCRRVATRHFSLHLRSRDGGFCRLGMAVSRKVSPDAVVRNRIKRQIRESFRQRRHGLPAGDCIVVARAGAGALGKAALRAELEVLWNRLLALPPSPPAGTIAPAATPGPEAPSSPHPESPSSPARPAAPAGE
ncbi:MAG: hypothetical protein KatS3mg128_1184 [Silanimonas sp.]|nr:MAG: hypothetical protein KatS3mg128_1184 [Silanimonas sp.]